MVPSSRKSPGPIGIYRLERVDRLLKNYTCASTWDVSTTDFGKENFSQHALIDLFTNTVAILNLLDLRSIIGCPGGTRSAFTRAFRAKRELQCICTGKKAIIITSKQGTTICFYHYKFFLGKLKEKSARKARVNTDASISDRAHAPWAFDNTP